MITVVKPYSVIELVARVRTQLRRVRPASVGAQLIGRLRKALCAEGGEDPLRTVRGADYALG